MAYTKDDIKRIRDRISTKKRDDNSSSLSSDDSVNRVRSIKESIAPSRPKTVYDDYAQMATRTPTEPTYRYNSIDEYDEALSSSPLNDRWSKERMGYTGKKAANAGINVFNHVANIGKYLNPSTYVQWAINGEMPNDQLSNIKYTPEEMAYEDLKTERNLYAAEHIYDERYKPVMNNADYKATVESMTDDDVYQWIKKHEFDTKDTSLTETYLRMTPEQKEVARYYMSKGEGEFQNYIRNMGAYVSKPYYEAVANDIKEYADSNGNDAVITAATTPLKQIGNFAPLEYAQSALYGTTPNPYGGISSIGNIAQEAQNYVAEDLSERYGDVVGKGYQIGTSMIDSYIGARTFGKAYAPLMSGGVYNTTYKELTERGADSEEALYGALLAGGAEWAFETISLENLLKPKNPATFKQLLMEYAKQSGIEASEEYFTELASIMNEELVQGTHSEIQQMITKMRNDGKSEDEIKAEVSKYVTRRAGEAAIGGAISGGGLSMLMNTSYYANNVDVGKRTNRETLSNAISTLDENSETYKKYNGQDLSKLKNSEIGAIVSEVYEEASKFDNETYHNALVNALEAEGFNEDDAAEYADALTADKPSPLQKLMLKDNEIVRKVKQTVDETVKAELDATSKLRAIAVESAVTSKEQADHKKRADKIFAKIKTGDTNKVKEEPAEILGIEKKNGRYVVRTDKGNVNLSDISVTENTAKALAYAVDYDNPDFQAAFIRNYNGQNMDEYEVYAYNVFMSGQQYDSDILSNANLDEALGGHDAVSDFLESGRMSSESSSRNVKEIERVVEEAVNEFSGEIKPVKGTFTSKVNPKSLKPTKQGIYAVLKGMAEAGGIPTEVIYDTETSDNGLYRRSDGVIVINLAAKEYINSSGYRSTFVLPAYAHELTHWMRPNASDSYDALSNAVFKYLATEGMNIDDEVAKKIKEYADANIELDDEDAKEEIVAQACENMLNDTKVMEKILEKMTAKELTGFKAALQKFFKAVKDFINKLGSKSTNDYVKALDKYYDELADLWAEGIATAMVRQQIINGNAAIDVGVQIDESTHTVAHSVRTTVANTYKQLGYSKYEDALEFMATSIANQMYEESKWNSDEWLKAKDDAMKWIQAEESVSAFILQSVETKKWLDYDADERFEAIKGDTDYPQGTLDLSNRCRKREVFTKIFDNLQTANPNMLFTAEDIAAIRDTLEEAKVETACALCYVEDRRQHLGKIADKFITAYKKALTSKDKVIMYVNSKGEISQLNATKDEKKAYGIDLYKATDKYVPTQADLITYEGFKNLEIEHPDVAHAFTRWNRKGGQNSGRLIEGHAEYKRELLKWSEEKIQKANNLGGFRIFSFSDLEGIHVIDVMQAIIDASVMGIKIQAYTKVPAFAKIVKDTGIKVNLSLIPANVDSKNAYAYVNNKWVKVSNKMVENGIAEVDGKEYLAVDIKEGIDVTSKDFDMYRDNPNIGLEITGISDRQMKLAMADPNIDYIIPFHTNQGEKVLKIKKIDTWHNYKLEQTDKIIGKDKGEDINIYTDVIEKYNVKTKNEFVEAFKKEIKAQKKTARFNRFMNEEGYYKTLLDYKLFDADGNILKQENVIPRFDEDTLKFVNEFLKEDMKRSKNMKLSDEVMDMIYDTLEKRGKKVNPISDAKHSLQRDSEGRELTENQIKFFENSKVRDNNGNLLRMYHGTDEEFYEFLRDKIGKHGAFEGAGFNFTPSKGRAQGYGGKVMEGYINITNPLSAEKKTITIYNLAKLIAEIDPTGDDLIANYASDTRDYGTPEFVRRESYEMARQIWHASENDVDIYSEMSSASGGKTTLMDAFEKLGYDGLIHYDEGKIKTVITFNSNQFKDADNLNPTENADRRYSLQRADKILGKNSKVPTKEEVVSGNATYGGLPIVYKPNMHAEAENYTTEIWVSDKLFNYSEEVQRHILNHEVAHNLSDEMQREHLANWREFASIFIQEKKVPESSQAYKNGKRTYWEGLYGDMHATAINETTTRAITEYLDDPDRLKQRSKKAYDTVDEFMKRNGYVGDDVKNPDIRHSIQGDYGYHAGDLGKAEPLGQQGYKRATGHYGTGTYFVGDEAQINIGGYKERPHEKVDFSKYKLFKPREWERADALHNLLKFIDGGLVKEEWLPSIRDNKYTYIDRFKYFDSFLNRNIDEYNPNWEDEDIEAWQTLAKDNNVEYRDWDTYLKEEYDDVTDKGGIYRYEDYDGNEQEVFDTFDYIKSKYREYLKDHVGEEIDKLNKAYRTFVNLLTTDLRFELGYSKVPNALEKLVEYQKTANEDDMTADSYATVFMKALGYEGVDVRGIEGFDDTGTGSVIYDLKDEDLARKKEIGTARFSRQREGLDVNSKRLEKENKLLKSDIDALQEFIKINKRLSDQKEWNPLKTEAITKNVIEKYKSTIDPKQLRQMLSRLYTYITETLSSDSADTSMDAIMNECYAVAAEVYKDIKKKPTITKTQILDELKKANVEGKADSELIEQIKDAVALANEEDYIRKLGVDIYNGYWKMATLKTQADINKEKLEAAKSEQARLKANAKEQVKNQKLADAMHYGREIAENKRTSREALTKEKQRRIHELREAHKKMLEELDKQKLADSMHYGRLLEKARQDRDNKIKEAKQHIKDTEAKRKENAEKRNLIKKITTVSTDLLERITHPDKKHIVPAPMIEPLRNLCRAIDYSSQQLLGIRQGKNAYTPTRADYRMGDLINEVSEVLSRMKSQAADGNDSFDLAGLTIAPEYADELLAIGNRLNKTKEIIESGKEFTLQLMSVEDLKVLADVLTDIKTNINNLNRIISSSNAHEVDYIGRALMNHMISLGETNVPKLLKFPLKYMTMMNKTPYYFFKHLGEGGQEMFELFMSGWDKYSFNSLKILEETQKLYKPEDVTKWDETIHTFEITLPLTIGEIAEGKQARRRTIQMSESQIMSLYCMAKREQARFHILDGNGIVVDEIKRKGINNDIEKQKATIISEADLNRIIKVVENDPKMKRVADGIQEFMNTTCSKWINEVYYKLHGTLLATEKFYFPISVDQDTMATQAKEKHDSLYGLINQNWAKPLMPNSKNQVLVSNIFDVFVDHALSTAKYNALALPVLDMIKVWNYSEATAIGEEGKEEINNVKIAIRHAIGAEGNSYISHLLHDINGDSESGRYDDLWMRFIKRSKIAKVGANATTALLQPLSYERAAYVMDAKYLAAALKQKPQVEKCFKNIGVAAWKHMGFYDTNMTASLSRIIRNTETLADKAVSASLLPAELMDELTWGYLYNAVELECKDRYKNLTPQALDAMVAKRLREVLYATQVFDSTLSRTDMMRSPSTSVKLWTAFGSEPILHINMLMDALTEFTYERKMHGTKVAKRKYGAQLARAGVVYLVASILESALREVMSRWKKYDDEDDEFFDGFLVALLKRTLEELNPLNKIPIIKDVISVIKSALNGWSQRTDMDMEWISSIVDAYGSMIKAVQNGEMSFKTFQKIVDAVSLSTGIPIGNAVKELKSVWNNLVGRFTGWYLK